MIVYTNKTGSVSIIKRTFMAGHYFLVEIEGRDYGPFNWRTALEWYRRHK